MQEQGSSCMQRNQSRDESQHHANVKSTRIKHGSESMRKLFATKYGSEYARMANIGIQAS